MTTKTAEYALSVTVADDYEPFVVGGQEIGEVHWIRTEGAEGATLVVGLALGAAELPVPVQC